MWLKCTPKTSSNGSEAFYAAQYQWGSYQSSSTVALFSCSAQVKLQDTSVTTNFWYLIISNPGHPTSIRSDHWCHSHFPICWGRTCAKDQSIVLTRKPSLQQCFHLSHNCAICRQAILCIGCPEEQQCTVEFAWKLLGQIQWASSLKVIYCMTHTRSLCSIADRISFFMIFPRDQGL